jgi:hypothetical protein
MTEMKKSKALNTSLWVIQVLLAAAFGMSGFMKVSSTMEQLAQSGMSFVNEYAESTVRFIGISELLGAIGLILPAALRILPVLTPGSCCRNCHHHDLGNRLPHFAQRAVFPRANSFPAGCIVAWGRYSLAPVQPKVNLTTQMDTIFWICVKIMQVMSQRCSVSPTSSSTLFFS